MAQVIQSGSVTVNLQATGEYDNQVTFSSAFTAAPVVICSLSDTGPYSKTAYLTCMAYNVTGTGFNACIKTFPSATVVASPVVVYWVAIQ